MLPKRKKIIVLTAVLVVIIGAIVFLTPSPIPEDEAIAKVRDHFEEWEDIKIIKTELRPPTEQEKSSLLLSELITDKNTV